MRQPSTGRPGRVSSSGPWRTRPVDHPRQGAAAAGLRRGRHGRLALPRGAGGGGAERRHRPLRLRLARAHRQRQGRDPLARLRAQGALRVRHDHPGRRQARPGEGGGGPFRRPAAADRLLGRAALGRPAAERGGLLLGPGGGAGRHPLRVARAPAVELRPGPHRLQDRARGAGGPGGAAGPLRRHLRRLQLHGVRGRPGGREPAAHPARAAERARVPPDPLLHRHAARRRADHRDADGPLPRPGGRDHGGPRPAQGRGPGDEGRAALGRPGALRRAAGRLLAAEAALDGGDHQPDPGRAVRAGAGGRGAGRQGLGGRGGGYMYFLAAAHRRHEVARAVAEAGCTLVPFGFEPRGLQVWRVP